MYVCMYECLYVCMYVVINFLAYFAFCERVGEEEAISWRELTQ